SRSSARRAAEGRMTVETNGTPPDKVRAPRRWISAAGLVGAGLLAGGILAGSQLAGAATPTSGSATVAAASTAASGAKPDPATVAHGPGETLLTGAAAAKATARSEERRVGKRCRARGT